MNFKSTNVDESNDLYILDAKSKCKQNSDSSCHANGQSSQLHCSFSQNKSIYMNCIVIGNPFLVCRFNVTKAFLKKNKLTLGEVYVKDSTDRSILIEAMANFRDTLLLAPGGDSLNIAQVAQSISIQTKSFVLMGVRAFDEDSNSLTKMMKETSLSLKLEEKKSGKTNVIAMFCYKNSWCELYYLDTSSVLNSAYLDKPFVTRVLERANVLFTTDWSIFMMQSAVKKLVYYASASFKVFCTSVTFTYLMPKIADDLLNVLKYTDILFLTIKSAKALIKLYKIKISKMCLRRKKLLPKYITNWIKTISTKACAVIITDGLKEVFLMAVNLLEVDLNKTKNSVNGNTGILPPINLQISKKCNNLQLQSYFYLVQLITLYLANFFVQLSPDALFDVVAKIKSHYHKDATMVDMFGTHQSFVGGFLAMMIQGFPMEACLDSGFLCASMVASQVGIRFPNNKNLLLEEWYDSHVIKHNVLSKKCVSTLQFTFFHTPWKLHDIEDNGDACISSTADSN